MEQINAIKNLEKVNQSIEKAEQHFKRQPGSVKLVAVSKTYGGEAIRPVLLAGQKRFGENRMQEAKEKWPELRQEFSDIELHLIGPLQSNKTADAVALFDVIQTIDRDKIARTIAAEMVRQQRKLKLFVQVNIGNEPQKAGIEIAECEGFVRQCREKYQLEIAGLMCIPPFDQNPGPYFALLQKLAKQSEVEETSMGMSADFETAISFGADYVRVGSAIFGSR